MDNRRGGELYVRYYKPIQEQLKRGHISHATGLRIDFIFMPGSQRLYVRSECCGRQPRYLGERQDLRLRCENCRNICAVDPHTPLQAYLHEKSIVAAWAAQYTTVLESILIAQELEARLS